MLGRSEKECPFCISCCRERLWPFRGTLSRIKTMSGEFVTSCRFAQLRHFGKCILRNGQCPFPTLCGAIKKKPLRSPDPTYHITTTTALRTVWLRALPGAENDPWRFRQQSSRVISIQFWYLTSLFTSLSVGSDMGFKMASDKTCKLGGFLPMSVLALIVLGAGYLPVHWYHLFVPIEYHHVTPFARRKIP